MTLSDSLKSNILNSLIIQVFCLAWSPLTHDNNKSILAMGNWNQSIIFYDQEKQQQTHETQLKFNPLCIRWLSNAQFFVVSGTSNEACLFSRSGSFIFTIATLSSWIWHVDVCPDGHVALGTD